MLSKKGVMPNEYLDSLEKIEETFLLFLRNKFYSFSLVTLFSSNSFFKPLLIFTQYKRKQYQVIETNYYQIMWKFKHHFERQIEIFVL